MDIIYWFKGVPTSVSTSQDRCCGASSRLLGPSLLQLKFVPRVGDAGPCFAAGRGRNAERQGPFFRYRSVSVSRW
jgi:hypothetical protein